MSKKKVALVPVFACFLLLAMGALNHQSSSPSLAPGPSFLAQTVSLGPGLDDLGPTQLLERAVANLGPARVSWLRVATWQKQADDEVSFEADGVLVRGPHHCARLELTVRAGKEPATVVTVSDGVSWAQSRRLPGRSAEVTAQRFTTDEMTAMSAGQREDVLNAHGCGGPHGLLVELARHLQNLQTTRGIWQAKPVLRLEGTLDGASQGPPETCWLAPPRFCHLYLDAQTLWPHRVEWWAAKADGSPFLLLQVEFRSPEINLPLTHEECVRAFTFQPE